MTVEALILDADGVLIPPYRFGAYLEREYPSIAEQTGEFFTNVFRDCLVGKADLRAVLPAYLEKWRWPHSLDDFIDRWFDEERKVEERLLKVVRTLRQSGIRCFVATNQEQHRLDYMRSQMGFDDEFDEVFASASIGHAKPSEHFYRSITNDLDLNGENILFWDDTRANVDAAKACGWNAERYTNYDTFQEVVCSEFGVSPIEK